MSSPHRILVTGATGRQGLALIGSLLPSRAEIHALVRDPSSPTARSLAANGTIIIHTGDFNDAISLTRILSSASITAIFLNTSPTSHPGLETQHARNVLVAADQARTVIHVIYTSIMLTGTHDTFPNWTSYPSHSFMKTYWTSKHDNEVLVREWAARSPPRIYTILRPPTFMSNYHLPSLKWWMPTLLPPRLAMVTSMAETTRTMLIAPETIGACAAVAFLKPERFTGMELDIGAEALTPLEILGALAKVGRVEELAYERLPDEEVKRRIDAGDMSIASQGFFNQRSSEIDIVVAKKLFEAEGVRFIGFEKYLAERESVVKASFDVEGR